MTLRDGLRASFWLLVVTLLAGALVANVRIGFEQPLIDAGFVGLVAVAMVMALALFFLAVGDL